MIGFVKELTEITGLPFNEISKGFKVCLLDGNIVYVSNFIKILAYSSGKVVLKVKNNVLNVEGSEICISQLSNKEIILNGNFTGIYLDKPKQTDKSKQGK